MGQFENDTEQTNWYERNSEGADDRRKARFRPTLYSGMGKLPPQAVDLEEAVLGAIMLEKDAFLMVSDFLKADVFYKDSHQKIFSACAKQFADSKPIDILTVTQALRNAGELEMIGGAYYITELTNRVASAANIEHHARIVYQKFLQREMIRISTDVIQSAYEDTTDIFDLINNSQSNVFNLLSVTHGKDVQEISDLLHEAVEEMDKPVVDGLTGVGTGFASIDKYNGGWQPSDLTILAARPAMGKTALAVQWARNAAVEHGVPTAIFSLEMSAQQLTKRLIANETDIFLEKINKRSLNQYDKGVLKEKLEKLHYAPLVIDDSSAINIVEFRAKAIRLKKTNNIGLIIIDYLQLMHGDPAKNNFNREQEISRISRGLKQVAKELNISIIALSQLSRALESRAGAGKRPQLSDLRESGSIEQDADNVYFLYRPAYYGLERDKEGNSILDLAELICAKFRNGGPEILPLKFNGSLTRFTEWVPTVKKEDLVDQEPQLFQPPTEVKSSPDEDDLPF